MSVATEITRLQNAKTSLKASLNAKNDSEHQITDELIDEYSDFVDSIETGGGGAPFDWSSIGWNEQVKGPIVTQYNYTKQLYDEWEESADLSDSSRLNAAFRGNTDLVIAPNLNMVNVKSLRTTFMSATNLTYLPTLDISNVNDLYATFYDCTSLEEIPKLDYSKVTNFRFTFGGGTAGLGAKTIGDGVIKSDEPIISCDTMFRTAKKLTAITLDFNTINVIAMNEMFKDCISITNIDLSSFNTINVTNMNEMFRNCQKLEELDISNFEFRSSSYTYIFAGCGSQLATGLTKVYVKDTTAQSWILNLSTANRPSTWSTANVIVAGSSDDLRDK